jgi:AcrR family transcriptional regulator
MSPRRARAVSGRAGGDPAAALRELLVDTAERLLAERQVATITTRDIARAAGVSDGVLYNYFGDKHDLLLAALLRRYGSLMDRFDAAIPEPGTGTIEENLLAYARAAHTFQAELIPTVAGLLSEPLLMHRFLDEIHRLVHGPQRTMQRLTGYVTGEQELGRIDPAVDPVATATLLTGATLTLVAAAHLAPPGHRPGPEEHLPAVVTTLIRGLAGPALAQ